MRRSSFSTRVCEKGRGRGRGVGGGGKPGRAEGADEAEAWWEDLERDDLGFDEGLREAGLEACLRDGGFESRLREGGLDFGIASGLLLLALLALPFSVWVRGWVAFPESASDSGMEMRVSDGGLGT